MKNELKKVNQNWVPSIKISKMFKEYSTNIALHSYNIKQFCKKKQNKKNI